MTKRVQWKKILGIEGILPYRAGIYKDKNKFGFTITVRGISCNKKQLKIWTTRLCEAGFDAEAKSCQVSDYFGYAHIQIHEEKNL